MKTIRDSVFETNSSSCHVVTILTAYEKEQFKRGELLAYFYRSQNDKRMTQFLDDFRFQYEIEQLQWGYDYKKMRQTYTDIPRETIKNLATELWKILYDKMKVLETDVDGRMEAVFKSLKIKDKGFIERVKEFAKPFVGVYTLKTLFEGMKRYKMPNGDVIYFSCHEFEC